MSGRKRRGGQTNFLALLSPPEGGVWADFPVIGGMGCCWCFVCLQSPWPAWGWRNRGKTRAESHNPFCPSKFFPLVVCSFFHCFHMDSWRTCDMFQSEDKAALSKSYDFSSPDLLSKTPLGVPDLLLAGQRAVQAA